MHKLKRIAALALAATMVMGCSITALADPLGSGTTDGDGTSEGHVEKELINVVLPTIAAGSTPFAYTMDPERLIQATEAAMYADGAIFPEAESDTGVYFLTEENTYANESNTLQVINKSSCPITLTVNVGATASAGGKDIALATSSTVATTGTPDLYLGLKVGNDTQVVSTTAANVVKTIPGVESNFEIAVTENNGTKSYAYQQKASTTAWKAIDISMEGAVSNLDIASDTTAPKVTVTWSYDKAASDVTLADDVVDYSDAPANAAPTAASTATFVKGTGVTINTNLGSGNLAATAITKVQLAKTSDGTYSDADSSKVTISGSNVTILGTNYASVTAGEKRYAKIIFNDEAHSAKVVELTISE